MKTLIIIIAISSFFIGALLPAHGKAADSEGWTDEDTLTITASGSPDAGLSEQAARRASALKAARQQAESKIIFKFLAIRTSGSGLECSRVDSIISGVIKEFGELIKNGAVINSTYKSDDSCEIIYRIYKKGLKKAIGTGS